MLTASAPSCLKAISFSTRGSSEPITSLNSGTPVLNIYQIYVEFEEISLFLPLMTSLIIFCIASVEHFVRSGWLSLQDFINEAAKGGLYSKKKKKETKNRKLKAEVIYLRFSLK